jgi:hypothetical protein
VLRRAGKQTRSSATPTRCSQQPSGSGTARPARPFARTSRSSSTDLTDVDKLLLDQFEESWVADGELADQAQNNTIDNFRLVFDKKFLQTIFKKILDDEDFRAALGEFYLRKVYDRLQATPPSAAAEQ